jgi:signal recognition particle receptor subunit alpha
MLDSFEILTTSGVVLWSRSYAQPPVNSNIVNGLIREVFIEEKVLSAANNKGDNSAARNPTYKKEQYSVKWTTAKDLGLIFVVCGQPTSTIK